MLQRLDAFLTVALRGLARRPGLAALLVAAVAAAAILPGLFDLPPIDRTEVRYAQTSKQILESGNWVARRLQGEPKFTRPIGIFWLQAGEQIQRAHIQHAFNFAAARSEVPLSVSCLCRQKPPD